MVGVESLLPQSTKRWEPNQTKTRTHGAPPVRRHLFALDIDIVIAIGIVIVLVTLFPLSSSLIY